MRSTPLISCSIGVATVLATVFALAPGNVAVTVTVGGATSGYCAIGRPTSDTTPTIVTTIDSTIAKIGRAMKKCEMFTGWPSLGNHGFDGLVQPRAQQTLDDDAVVGLERRRLRIARRHLAAAVVEQLAGQHVAPFDDVLLVDQQQVAAVLVGEDRAVRDDRALARIADGDAHAHARARHQRAVGVRDRAARRDGAGAGVDLDVAE